MTGLEIAQWAGSNGFRALKPGCFQREEPTRRLVLEVKRMSFVLIEERSGSSPRIVSRLFKDMETASPTGYLSSLLGGR